MDHKQTLIVKYLILLVLGAIAIWQIANGKHDFGIGLLAGLMIAGVALNIKDRRLSKMVKKGMNPYDERVWMIAGKASYASMRIFALASALIILLGSISGPVVLVNPYNMLGICLSAVLLLYILFYYYYNNKM